jgi:hypothetical protein
VIEEPSMPKHHSVRRSLSIASLAVVCCLLLAGCFDNMYPTSNYDPYCDDFSP